MGALNVQRTLADAKRLEKSGELRTARALYRTLLNQFPKNARAKSALSTLEGSHPSLAQPPKDLKQQILNLFHASQFPDLSPVLAMAVAEYPSSAFLWNLRGMTAKALGDIATAETAFRKVTILAPQSPDGFINLGALLRGMGQVEAALKTYRQGQSVAPENPALWKNLGNLLGDLEAIADADAAYHRCLELAPETHDAAWSLLELYEKRNRLTDLEARLTTVSTLAPTATDALAHFTAFLHFRTKNYTAAEQAAHDVDVSKLHPDKQTSHLWLQAAIADKLGNTQDAFTRFTAMNTAAAKAHPAFVADVPAYLETQRTKADSTSAAIPAPAPDAAKNTQSPTFLVGFPRSGTTLLDTCLRGHPEIAVMEEIEIIAELAKDFPEILDWTPTKTLTPPQQSALQSAYWQIANRYLDTPTSSVVIDKMPLNLLNLHLLHSIFPTAKFILALRHPLDCVLSCFMQNFKLNLPMAAMLSTETAAELYDAGMQQFHRAADTYGLAVHRHKYETLIDAPEDTLRTLLSFLNLPWDNSVLDNVGTATTRGRINTPSYAQVSQPLYATSKERWRQYETELSPCKERLRHWITHYGYAL